MANQEHVELLKQGVALWNEWYRQHEEVDPDLRDADLNNADLDSANLINALLSGADLNGANLRSAHLYHANLSGADLSNANLHNALLNYTNLSGANLNGANLNSTHLSRADLSNANLSGATIFWTVFTHVDLRLTKGLLDLVHLGPSAVDLPTIQLPQDSSALHFLRGAGVPDEWIDFWRTTMANPIQYHSLFVSHSSEDDTLARRLHADLQAHGVRCWFAPEDMKIGDRFHARINEAIHIQDKLLLLLSKHAIQSDWVEIEVRAALEKEQRQHRDVLFPVRLDSSVMETSQAWAAMLRQSRHFGDFTNWTDPQAYQQAFERLLRDLKRAGELQNQEMKQ